MNVPYNNGKVSIGKYYQKPYYVEQDEDMIRLQGFLIGDQKLARQRYWSNFLYTTLLVTMVIVGLISYD
jgi:hypothetical protein